MNGLAGAALIIALSVPVMTSHAHAQEIDDIVVTARKRSETSLTVPVTISAVGAAEIQRRSITTMDALARVVPALLISDGGSSGLQGGIIAIRGISGSEGNPFADQAVSFAIDGVQVAKASVRRMGEMDMAQIEVLKGPQALFYGKNSPAGIISITTADPTASLEAGATAGYEFEAREARATAFLSGPVTPTLGIRVAGMMSDMQGWMQRVAPTAGVNVFGPSTARVPNNREYAGRVTLKWEPDDKFSARLKLSASKLDGTSSMAGVGIVSCGKGTTPQGVPASTRGVCYPSGLVSGGELGPNFGIKDARFGDGNTFLRSRQVLGGLELGYALNDDLQLTSVTGLYKNKASQTGNVNAVYLETGVGAGRILANYFDLDIRELTEEVRLTSSFAGRFNFMLGGLVQNSRNELNVASYFNALTPLLLNNYSFVQKGTAYSLFGQAQFDITPQVQLSAGGRYSSETKRLPVALNDLPVAGASTGLKDISGPTYLRRKSWHDFSPEVTLSYRPTQDLNVYAGYKEGFLSGGFNANATNQASVGGQVPAGIRSDYDQQRSAGWEAGIKAALFDRTLRTNLSIYTYKVSGLQVGVSVTNPSPQVLVRNAASVRDKGAEFDFNWRSPVEGLTINGAVAYNDAKYKSYLANCYSGQSSATCFVPSSNAPGDFTAYQSLKGQALARAPKWTGNMGFNYERPVGGAMLVGLSSNYTFSSSYFTDSINSPLGRQKRYGLFDATLRIADQNETWELALIGRNLTNEHTFNRSAGIPFTGTKAGCSPSPAVAPAGGCAGANVTNPTFADYGAFVDRGRQLLIRISYKFGNK